MIAYIGIGSNLNNPIAQVNTAIDALKQFSPSLKSSPLYCNPAMGPNNQEDYVNAVVKLDTQLSANDLLTSLQSIENQKGRKRTAERWSARTLDLDILLYENETINTDDLTVPHYDLENRIFFILPLHDIAPKLVLPNGKTIQSLLNQFSEETKLSMLRIDHN